MPFSWIHSRNDLTIAGSAGFRLLLPKSDRLDAEFISQSFRLRRAWSNQTQIRGGDRVQAKISAEPPFDLAGPIRRWRFVLLREEALVFAEPLDVGGGEIAHGARSDLLDNFAPHRDAVRPHCPTVQPRSPFHQRADLPRWKRREAHHG